MSAVLTCSFCQFLLQGQNYSSDEEGTTFLHHLPVEIDPQEFDEKGYEHCMRKIWMGQWLVLLCIYVSRS